MVVSNIVNIDLNNLIKNSNFKFEILERGKDEFESYFVYLIHT